MEGAPEAVKHAIADAKGSIGESTQPVRRFRRGPVGGGYGRRVAGGSGHSETTRDPNQMSQSVFQKKVVLSLLIGAALTPAAFAQVLGGAVNVNGGIGAQAGPVDVGGSGQVGIGAGMRSDAIREATRRARNGAVRAQAESRAAARATAQAAAAASESAALHAAGQANAAAGAGLASAQAARNATRSVAGDVHAGGEAGLSTARAIAAPSVAGNAQAGIDAAVAAQAGGSGPASGAVSGDAAATARSAVTAQDGGSPRKDEARSPSRRGVRPDRD